MDGGAKLLRIPVGAFKAHPFRKTATRQLAIGAALVALGLLTSLAGGALIALGGTFALVGAMLLYIGTYSRRQTEAVLLNNAAVDLVSRGQIADAEALLDAVSMASGNVRRAVGLQRAMIALRRADAGVAEEHANTVLGTSRDLLTRDAELSQNVMALAIRALARASMGKESEAVEDIAGVRSSEAAAPEALARVAVAQAVVVARRDDREALAQCLRTAAPLLEYTAPRERELLRAFRRMVQVRAGSVYREAARPAAAAREEPLIGDWVSRIVPQAAAFVTDAERLPQMTSAFDATQPDSFPVGAGSASIARASPRSKKTVLVRFLAVFCVILALFLAISLLTPDLLPGHLEPPGSESDGVGWLAHLAPGLCALFVAVFFGQIYVQLARARRGAAAVRHAMRVLIAGDVSEGARLLSEIVSRAPDAIAASAGLELTRLAERRCEMKQALELCDAALGRVSRSPQLRAMNSDILVPELVAQRALLLAALGRDQQADAELSTLAREHPTFAFMTRSVFRVRMAQALRRMNLDEAAHLARERTPELPLNRRDEMLADIVLALAGGKIVDGEVERIATELAEDTELATWIEFMAPGARAQLGARSRVRVEPEAPSDAELDGDEAVLFAARSAGTL